MDWNAELREQLDFYWQRNLRSRLEGLTDEEYFWEPVQGCWSIRPAGDGTFTADWDWPEPDPAPVTTIAWRIAHIAGGCLGFRASAHFGDGSLNLETMPWPGSVAAALDLLDANYDAWCKGVESLGEEGLFRPVGPAEGPYAESPYATLILHINREVMHHGGEIGVLRDLYRHQFS